MIPSSGPANSQFVWRVLTTATYDNATVYAMTYENGQPYYFSAPCMDFYVRGVHNYDIDIRDIYREEYGWKGDECSKKFCSVCELEI